MQDLTAYYFSKHTTQISYNTPYTLTIYFPSALKLFNYFLRSFFKRFLLLSLPLSCLVFIKKKKYKFKNINPECIAAMKPVTIRRAIKAAEQQ